MELKRPNKIENGMHVVIKRDGKKEREGKVINAYYEDKVTVLLTDWCILTVPKDTIYIR